MEITRKSANNKVICGEIYDRDNNINNKLLRIFKTENNCFFIDIYNKKEVIGTVIVKASELKKLINIKNSEWEIY